MCNLYTVNVSAHAIADAFKARMPTAFNAAQGDVYPGAPGMVVREADGGRVVQAMTWGFPLPQKSKKTGLPIKPKPVNNIADLSSFMWRHIAPRSEHRCLIPLTGFAEAEGEQGAKTRTWFRVKGQPVFAWAGMWKDSDEWGAVYSGLMTDCNAAVEPVHHRMPVLLLPDEWERWLHGSLDDVRSFQDRTFPAELTEIERTAEPWLRRKAPELYL
jgi:putative SOS response-associated peptidase YedK